MGTPSFSLISELFLQQMEHLHLAHLTTKLKIIDYFHYVDDILLILDSNYMTFRQYLMTSMQYILN